MWTGNRKSLIARWGKETEFFQKRWGKRKKKDIFEEKKEKKRENENYSSKLQRITLSSLLSIACLDLGSVRLLSQLLMSQFDRGAISFDNLIIIFHFPNHQLWWVCPWARSVRPCRFSWFCKTAGSKEMRNAANNFVFFLTKIQFSDWDWGGHSKRVWLHQVSLIITIFEREMILMTDNAAMWFFCAAD